MKHVGMCVLLFIISAKISFANTYTSQNNGTHDWENVSSWSKSPNESWVADKSQADNIHWHTLNIYGELYRKGNLGIASSGVLKIYDILVIYGDVNAVEGATSI
jgi:hypothetical protein